MVGASDGYNNLCLVCIYTRLACLYIGFGVPYPMSDSVERSCRHDSASETRRHSQLTISWRRTTGAREVLTDSSLGSGPNIFEGTTALHSLTSQVVPHQ